MAWTPMHVKFNCKCTTDNTTLLVRWQDMIYDRGIHTYEPSESFSIQTISRAFYQGGLFEWCHKWSSGGWGHWAYRCLLGTTTALVQFLRTAELAVVGFQCYIAQMNEKGCRGSSLLGLTLVFLSTVTTLHLTLLIELLFYTCLFGVSSTMKIDWSSSDGVYRWLPYGIANGYLYP